MLVILLKKIENLGERFDVVDVKPGFARNFLLAQGLAEIATQEKIKQIERKRKQQAEQSKEELRNYQKIVAGLDGKEIEVKVKVGDKGQIFGGVSPAIIAKKLKERGFDIEKNQIELPEKIEKLGEFNANIKLKYNLKARVKIIVKQEKEDEKN